MIKFVIQNLNKIGFKDEQIYTTIENKMKCGGCNIGKSYVCRIGLFVGSAKVSASKILAIDAGRINHQALSAN